MQERDLEKELGRFTSYAERGCEDDARYAGDADRYRFALHVGYTKQRGREFDGQVPTLFELVNQARNAFRFWYREELRVGHRYDHVSKHIPRDLRNNPEVRMAQIAYDHTAHLTGEDLLRLALSAKPGLLTEHPNQWHGVEIAEPLSVMETIEVNAYWLIIDELRSLRIHLNDEYRVEREIAERSGE